MHKIYGWTYNGDKYINKVYSTFELAYKVARMCNVKCKTKLVVCKIK